MRVTLTDKLGVRIQHLIDTGRYPDADAVVERALAALEAAEQERFLKLRELDLAGHNSGPGEELTEKLWDEIERSSEERFQRGEESPWHVCP
jgi:putative addiction module CopG family antidote